jgi:hypothetical protein
MAAEKRDSFGRFVDGPAGGVPADVRLATAKRPRRRQVFRHYKVDEVLSAEQRPEYEGLMDDPTCTIRRLREWLLARGHNVSSSAVSNHRLGRHLELRSIREATAQAAAYCELTRRHGAGAVAEASNAKFEIMLMQRLFNRPGAPQLRADEWQAFGKLVAAVIANRRNVEELRGEVEKADAEAAAKARPKASTHDIVERVRHILGLNYMGPEIPPTSPDRSSPSDF